MEGYIEYFGLCSAEQLRKVLLTAINVRPEQISAQIGNHFDKYIFIPLRRRKRTKGWKLVARSVEGIKSNISISIGEQLRIIGSHPKYIASISKESSSGNRFEADICDLCRTMQTGLPYEVRVYQKIDEKNSMWLSMLWSVGVRMSPASDEEDTPWPFPEVL